jgi:hypothetical protein
LWRGGVVVTHSARLCSTIAAVQPSSYLLLRGSDAEPECRSSLLQD